MDTAKAATWSPREALRQAVDCGLVVRRESPLNCETPLGALGDGAAVETERFYRRNHFPIPQMNAEAYRLSVSGLVERPLSLRMSELLAMPARSLTATLECAGNGRMLFQPAIEGERWDLGAVSTARWGGVSLREVLERAGVRSGAREVVFRGADGGALDGLPAPIRFERSLPLDVARHADVMLVHTMNGKPLTAAHGFPLRLVVPGWYAVASVKWLTEIELIDHALEAHYQTDKYWYEWPRDGRMVREPVTTMRVRSLITSPEAGAELARGEIITVRGVAWSGAAPIARVEVSAGGGAWQAARLLDEPDRYGPCRWEARVKLDESGVLRARATDAAGNTQPEQAEWNRLGYGNNSIHEVPIRIR